MVNEHTVLLTVRVKEGSLERAGSFKGNLVDKSLGNRLVSRHFVTHARHHEKVGYRRRAKKRACKT